MNMYNVKLNERNCYVCAKIWQQGMHLVQTFCYYLTNKSKLTVACVEEYMLT